MSERLKKARGIIRETYSVASVWDCCLIFSEAIFKAAFPFKKKNLLQKYNDYK